jgi:hypothetical protein
MRTAKVRRDVLLEVPALARADHHDGLAVQLGEAPNRAWSSANRGAPCQRNAALRGVRRLA